MTDHLYFVLTHKAHPYSEDAISATEAWGELAIHINNELLLRTEWNLEAFIDWYLETRDQHFSTSLPDLRPGESLAQASERAMQGFQRSANEAEADRLSTLLYAYRSAHALQFAFRGSKFPNILLGIHHAQGEISFCAVDDKTNQRFRELSWLKDGSWAYTFDIPDFEAYMDQHLKDFLREWLTRTNNPHAIAQAHRLLDAF